MKFEILKKEDDRWNEIVHKSLSYDFHHTKDYHIIETSSDEESILFVASSGESFICFPFIKRKVFDSEFFDLTSVYGYGGPIYSDIEVLENLTLITFFQNDFLNYCNKNNIISAFSRLHPLIDQSQILSNLGTIVNLNKTVSIDLTKTLDDQRKEFGKSVKWRINRLRKSGLTLLKGKSEGLISDFKIIYEETMNRLNASERYYFSFDYFKSFLNSKCFESEIYVLRDGNEPVAASIFTFTKEIMQYHLSGTNPNYFKESPMNLLLEEARITGTNLGLKKFHLGGGLNGSDEDNLFKYKSGFSKDFHQFSVWNLIVDQEKYDSLVKTKSIDIEQNRNFFPLYRA